MVALSSCEAEYNAGAYAACQAVWLHSVLSEMTIEVKEPIQLLVDNKSAINLANNPISHGRSKHIETRYHFLREQVNSGKLKLVYCPTQQQLADVLTKPLKKERFEHLRNDLGIFEALSLN